MSKEALKWASRQRIADQTLMTVLRAVAFLADKGTGECRKSQSILSTETGLTDRAIRSSLVVLERLEVITRKPRSKGKYGRTTDLIILSLDRNFDVSRGAVQAIRKSLKSALQPERGSASKKVCNRNQIPLQPERGSREYNTVDTEEPYQVGVSSKVEGCSATSGEPHPAERASYPANVISLSRRGVA